MNISHKLITEIDRNLLQYIEGEMTVKEVAERAGLNYSRVQMQLARMTTKTLLIRVRKGVYTKNTPETVQRLLEANREVKPRQETYMEEKPDTLVADLMNVSQEVKDEVMSMIALPRSAITKKMNLSRLAVSLILDLEAKAIKERENEQKARVSTA